MQKIFTSKGIKSWDAYTIESQKISSIDLMDRAAHAFCNQFILDFPVKEKHVYVLCGPGNNGGDGYAIARILRNAMYTTYVVEFNKFQKRSDDADAMRKLAKQKIDIQFLSFTEFSDLDLKENRDMLIDAIFGSGLNRKLEPWLVDVIQLINSLEIKKVAVDIPTGAYVDSFSTEPILQVDLCYSFQSYKYSLLFPESAEYCKETICIAIGLNPDFENEEEELAETITEEHIIETFPKREKFTHKGDYGHALFVGGSTEKMGAALLSCQACMQTGVGLLTAHIPNSGNHTFNQTLPEAMLLDEKEDHVSLIHSLEKTTALGYGPGMGTALITRQAFLSYLKKYKLPSVIDADALNIIATEGLDHLPRNAILTPHRGEFKRLFGESPDSIHRHALQKKMSSQYEVYIILKGAHSCLTTPEGKSYFLSIGNAGMATAGAGDVLTGIILSLLAQGNTQEQAALSGMYLHALAGDLANLKSGSYALTASAIIEQISNAIQKIQNR